MPDECPQILQGGGGGRGKWEDFMIFILKIFHSFSLGNKQKEHSAYLEFTWNPFLPHQPSPPPPLFFVFCFFSKYAYPTCVQNSERFPWKHNIERPYVQTAHNFKQSRLIGKKEKKSCFFFLFAFDFFQKDKMKGTVIHILSPVNSQWGFRIKR